MKKMLLSVLAVVALAIVPTLANDVPISAQKLPAEAQKFLKMHFKLQKKKMNMQHLIKTCLFCMVFLFF